MSNDFAESETEVESDGVGEVDVDVAVAILNIGNSTRILLLHNFQFTHSKVQQLQVL